MVVTLGENAHSYSLVKKWDTEFKRDMDSLEDDPRQRRLVIVARQETIAKIHDIIMADRRVTEYYIATELGISDEPHPCSQPQRTSYVQGVSTLSSKPQWT